MKTRVYNCPVEATLDVIGGKWKPLILWYLSESTLRFSELKKKIPGITEKMLTQHLRELEADGIVARKVFATVPPRVEYSLTEYGASLKRALKAICDWGLVHIERTNAKIASPARASASRASGPRHAVR
jgi:DNA-binding HxlR family transcriptional regulator